eukprot:Platyproteum_vivax@DN2180_c0_g1_i1.p1
MADNVSCNVGGGLSMPAPTPELKKQEEEAMHGDDLLVVCQLPDGKTHEYRIKIGQEVGYVKLLLAQTISRPVNQISFFLEGSQRPMIDPLSFADFPQVKSPECRVTVQLSS